MKNWNYKLLFIVGLFISFQSFAQERNKLGFDLIFHLDTIDKSAYIPLLIEGNNESVKELIKDLEGNIFLEIGNLFSLEIPAKNLEKFSESKDIYDIEYENSYPKYLSDTMLIQTNMDSVFNMNFPIRTKFTGKGVILGVIDSGIELDHPDFKDSTGKTRVLYVWDQGVTYDPSRKAGKYNYGVEWDSASINQQISTHDDKANQFGHGSMVTGAAASNALATGNFKGVAPEVNIISVATDFSRNNWLQSVAEAVDYIFNKADSLGMPCVINASIGTYVGSHDGKDIAARMIDQMIKAKSGRSFVCAAGNAGTFKFHLQHELSNDTNFSWFNYHPNLFQSKGGAYIEAWADTADLNNIRFSIGADFLSSNTYNFIGRTAFDSIQNRLNTVYIDSILNSSLVKVADVFTYAERSQGRYRLEIAIIDPDSTQYSFRLETRGTGKIDIWSNYNLTRGSNIINSGLPSSSSFPEMLNYKRPDSLQTIVSSFTCLPSVITVGNYINRNTYMDVNGNLQNMQATPGQISINSSLGPNRNGYLKPDLSSAGDFMMSTGRIATMNTIIQTQPSKIAFDSLHMRNGGTSMASPTVAGMVALYMQQCSKADNSQMKNDLINSVKTDAFTGILSNPKWGNGKADAFQFLSKNAFQPTINSSSTAYCNGDSVLLSINNAYTDYYWNMGDTTNSIYINSTGKYHALVKNQNQCVASTDTLDIVFHPKPTKPNLNLSNDSIIADKKGSYSWFLNGSLINGFSDSILILSQNGDYYAIFSDSNNCYSVTDTITYLITSLENYNSRSSTLFPNPNSGNFSIQSPKLIREVRIKNISGQLVYRKEYSLEQLIHIQLGQIKKGVYFVEIEYNSKELELYKLVINL